ncbi:hypothetical protein JX265_009521 [Neoarthrinium moseri]|uniref:Uncharacterized protein n=1 Tax=Neoarthrinium moseri TaxID=1658444 RepID=A0A9Q0AMK1_9PEZI|nr:hypothetical protein JX265_009521 [Neoarthrinium moseri]
MSSLIVTIVVVVVLVVVLGGGILACALGWEKIIARVTPNRWQRKPQPSLNEKWPKDYPYPSRSSVETDWAGSPISSPASSPVASPSSSPRSSRHNSDSLTKGRSSTREYV